MSGGIGGVNRNSHIYSTTNIKHKSTSNNISKTDNRISPELYKTLGNNLDNTSKKNLDNRTINTDSKEEFNSVIASNTGKSEETKSNMPASKDGLKWKTSLTGDFGFKKSSHWNRFASIMVGFGDNFLKIISIALEKITGEKSIFHVSQSNVSSLKTLNDLPVINSQKEIKLEDIIELDSANGSNKMKSIEFASSLIGFRRANGMIFNASKDMPRNEKSKELVKPPRDNVFSLDSVDTANALPPEIKENVDKFMGQLKGGGFEFCDDGFIRQIGNSDAFEVKLGYDNNTGKVFLSFSGTEIGNKRTGTVGSDIAQHFGFTDNLYKTSILMADMAKQCFGDDKLMLAGLSLGGGMAQLAAAVTGLEAVVVNPAPINKTIWARTGLSNDQLTAANGRIYQLTLKGDILSDRAFSNSPESKSAQIGQKIVIDFPNENHRASARMSHSGPTVARCMRRNVEKFNQIKANENQAIA
ncbi:MAG: hypothetical protein LBI37_00540 [Puniceicoccales bacterium]|jgi:hypothetical protein|nr:hypothetical protein [Puniceicoccales bacterium]